MSSLADAVPLPSKMNAGLTACREDQMLAKFGKPGELTPRCSNPTGPIKSRLRYGVDVGPFKVSGLDYAVESLSQIFSQLLDSQPSVYPEIKTAGMLCVRQIHVNPAHYSNHSWGSAIDLYFGSGVLPQGKPLTQRGFLQIFETFNQHGWFWGAGFSGMSVDSMHFELANETILNLDSAPMTHSLLVAADSYISATGYDVVDDA